MHQNGVAPFWYFMSNNNIMTREGGLYREIIVMKKRKECR